MTSPSPAGRPSAPETRASRRAAQEQAGRRSASRTSRSSRASRSERTVEIPAVPAPAQRVSESVGPHDAGTTRASRREQRHQGRHRGTPQSRSSRHARKVLPGFALPTAAAAALVLTATGATVVDASPVALDLTGSQDAVQHERNQRASANAAVEARQLRDQRLAAAAADARARETAARAAARVAVVEARARAVQKEAAEKARRQWVEPVDGCAFSSPFGTRWGRLHAGNDFACTMNTPIKAMSGGTVVFTGYMGGYGNKVEIKYWDGTVSYYGHMNEITAHEGDTVLPGDLVGYSGNSGRSTGPHLHLEIHPEGGGPIDPLPWLRDMGLYTKLTKNLDDGAASD